MPGDPFKKPARPRATAKVKTPAKPNQNKRFVPKPTSPVGNAGKSVPTPKQMGVRVTTKGRHGRSVPPVRQGAQTGTPGRSGS